MYIFVYIIGSQLKFMDQKLGLGFINQMGSSFFVQSMVLGKWSPDCVGFEILPHT